MLTKKQTAQLALQIKNTDSKMVERFLSLDEQMQTDIIGMLFEKHQDRAVKKLFEQIIKKLKHPKPSKQQTINNQVVLASTSPRRQYILKEILKVPYTSLSSPSLEHKPRFYNNMVTVTKTIASIKLIALMKQQKITGKTIIASDTLVYLPSGLVLGKLQEKTIAKQIQEAKNILLNILPGKKHFISTTVVVLDLVKNKLYLKELSGEIKFKKLNL